MAYRVTPDGLIHEDPHTITVKIATLVRQGFDAGVGDKWINPEVVSWCTKIIDPEMGRTTFLAWMQEYDLPGNCIDIRQTHKKEGSWSRTI